MHRISRALDHLLRATGDPIRALDCIGPGDPEHWHAEVIRAAAGVLAKVPDALPPISRAAREADDPGIPPRLRAHLEAARLWVQGDAVQAARRYGDILALWPRDLLAMRLALSCYFFVGQPEKTCSLIDEVVKEWPRQAHGVRFVLAMASFAHAEVGHADRAEQLGREALAHDPACPMGVHAVAHAIAHSGRPSAGALWMREQRAHWTVPSRMLTHNAWHLAMFDLDDDRLESALSILDTSLLQAARTSPVDACDATTLLGRLAAKGLDMRARWLRLSDTFERVWQPGFWPYVDLHAAIAHLQAGHRPRAGRLTRSVELCAAEDNPTGIRARNITVPVLRAIDVWMSGDDRHAGTGLSNLRPLLDAAGGSRIQVEVLAALKDVSALRASVMSTELAAESHDAHHGETPRGRPAHRTDTSARQPHS